VAFTGSVAGCIRGEDQLFSGPRYQDVSSLGADVLDDVHPDVRVGTIKTLTDGFIGRVLS